MFSREFFLREKDSSLNLDAPSFIGYEYGTFIIAGSAFPLGKAHILSICALQDKDASCIFSLLFLQDKPTYCGQNFLPF
jgi:hypothetical protein